MLSTRFSSESSSFGASVTVAVGPGGISGSALATAPYASSFDNSDNTFARNARIQAGETFTLTTGEDATFRGAVVEARDIDLDIGDDLTVASVQDTGTRNAGGFNASLSVSVGLDGQSGSVGGSIGGSTGSGEKRWTSEQTALIAEETVDIRVEDRTDLVGAVIASRSDDLTLDTGSFTYRDLQDVDCNSDFALGISKSF